MHYVNVYKQILTYGGSEEGGWWYDRNYPVKSRRFTSLRKQKKFLKQQRNFCQILNSCLPSYSSVRGGRQYIVEIEDRPASLGRREFYS